MDKRIKQISELLMEAEETHDVVFRMSEGEDMDWASWYADWLISHSELPKILGVTPVRSELIYMLVKLDKKYKKEQPQDSWEEYSAKKLLSHFSHN